MKYRTNFIFLVQESIIMVMFLIKLFYTEDKDLKILNPSFLLVRKCSSLFSIDQWQLSCLRNSIESIIDLQFSFSRCWFVQTGMRWVLGNCNYWIETMMNFNNELIFQNDQEILRYIRKASKISMSFSYWFRGLRGKNSECNNISFQT